MKKYAVAFAVSCTLAACGGSGTVNGPDNGSNQTATPVAEATPAPAPSNPTVVPPADPNPKSVDAWIGNGGSFYAKNLADTPANFVFYTTSFDKQTYTPGDPVKKATVAKGDVFQDTFDTTCRQVDGAFNSTDGYIFVAAFLDKDGKVFKNDHSEGSNAKITECRKCDPSRATWVIQEAEYGEWTVYTPTQSESTQVVCIKYERRRVIVKEKNSCSGETRVKSDTYETRQTNVDPIVTTTYEWGSNGYLDISIGSGDSSPDYYLFSGNNKGDRTTQLYGPLNYAGGSSHTITPLPVNNKWLSLYRKYFGPFDFFHLNPQWENLGSSSSVQAKCSGIPGPNSPVQAAWTATLGFQCYAVPTKHYTCPQTNPQ